MMANNRLEQFKGYKSHPWLKKAYAKMTKKDLEIAINFIESNHSLSPSEFEHKVNRMFIDKIDKPKNFTIILELLSCCNS